MRMENKLFDRYQILMKELAADLEDSFVMADEDFFYDRDSFMKTNYEHYSEIYKSNKKEDKETVKNYLKQTIVDKINKYLRFERDVYETDNGVVYNFPKGELPKFYLKDVFEKRLNSLKKYIRR